MRRPWVGSVFDIQNKSRKAINVNLFFFPKQFSNLLASHPTSEDLANIEKILPGQTFKILIIQKLDEV